MSFVNSSAVCENNDNPYDDRRESIQIREQIATDLCEPNDQILSRGQEIQQQKIRQKDALNSHGILHLERPVPV
jgi:hypothetical protein